MESPLPVIRAFPLQINKGLLLYKCSTLTKPGIMLSNLPQDSKTSDIITPAKSKAEMSEEQNDSEVS